MGKILEALGEYFFGTKQKKYYKEQINHAQKCAQNQEDLEYRLKYLKREQRVDIFFGKTLPNFIDAGGIFISFATKEPSVYLVMGEIFRNYWTFVVTRPRNKRREKIKRLEEEEYAYQKSKDLSQSEKLDNLLDSEST